MAIIKWTPFFEEPLEEMEKMLHGLAPSNFSKSIFTPAVDIYEDKDNIIVETQLAGIDSDNVDISVENDVLTIKGEGEKKSEVEEKDYYRKEIRRGNFYRSIQLPSHVISNKASAVSEDGVLKISIPKAKEENKTKIKIETKKK